MRESMMRPICIINSFHTFPFPSSLPPSLPSSLPRTYLSVFPPHNFPTRRHQAQLRYVHLDREGGRVGKKHERESRWLKER